MTAAPSAVFASTTWPGWTKSWPTVMTLIVNGRSMSQTPLPSLDNVCGVERDLVAFLHRANAEHTSVVERQHRLRQYMHSRRSNIDDRIRSDTVTQLWSAFGTAISTAKERVVSSAVGDR